MRLSLLVLGMLLSSVLVGCHTCSHCDGSFVGDDGVRYKPVKPNPVVEVFKKKDCSCKKEKHKHKGSDNCPFCTSEGEFASHGGMPFDGMSFGGGSSCSGCGAPAAMGQIGCSGCGAPTSFPMATSGCSSCGGAIESFPHSGCSACQGGMPHHGTPSGAVFNGEVIPGNGPTPAPPAEPAPIREATPPAPMSPANGTTLIPTLPPSSGPRQVHWVPTPVK